MALRIGDDDFRFVLTMLHSKARIKTFLDALKNKSPDFFYEIDKLCEEFVDHQDIHNRKRRCMAAGFFTGYVCIIIGALYSANGEKVPPDTSKVFQELRKDCASLEHIQERFDLLSSLHDKWASYSFASAMQEGFCEHGLGYLYALAEAFIIAQKEDEQRSAEQKALSEDVARRTKNLSPKILQFIESMDFTL